GPSRSCAFHVDGGGGEVALAPEEAVTYSCLGIHVVPHDLALRIEEEGLRESRAGRVDRFEVSLLAQEIAEGLARGVGVPSYPVAPGVDSVDAGVANGVGRVEWVDVGGGEVVLVPDEAVRVAVLIDVLPHDLVRAIAVGVRRVRPGHIDRSNVV